ncbi:MAG: arginine--tRNA ligase [Lachnospiraceae bacterium]|nr:arginine--tRNA ligase [Lachnospiraceae bacterium]MCH4064467.1 arginine--tRNA ligase [Lachnospiraceae bacterium]MCH4104698.1 arginine--tRNA ligase [Lachnospiraceae bacterium]MCI1308659.1 arginine--tRNA ligase [Lachnospiraceae bacterium]MCI1333328.1 arginine--tRNA ligase [Lachnospiraceae bacterium]
MKTTIEIMSEQLGSAFAEAGYDKDLGRVRTSDRPDLAEYQCNGAMAGAKLYRKAPFLIAGDVAAVCEKHSEFVFTAAVMKPGFINLRVKNDFLADYLKMVAADPHLSIPQEEKPKKIIVDYGGPNVAKPLHVGHLRSAVIGESIKRICRATGNEVLGDVHLGDWGLQMGLIITELRHEQPDLPYFDENAESFPEEAPFTISELEKIYPTASAKSKEDEAYRAEALEATKELQLGRKGYMALWRQIMKISVADLKRNYERLDVHFDLWKAESDAQPIIPWMIDDLKKRGIAHEDQGALIVDVTEPTDKKEVPPCLIQKSDGSSLYATTDLATVVDRMRNYHPDAMIYLADKRQALHYTQFFRVSRIAGYVDKDTELDYIGFGTMNGKDGKPFKTREGGVMRLEILLDDIEAEMKKKIADNRNVRSEDADETAKIVSLAAVKYGDLSNQASKDYVFDVDKFTSFEGNTGPYILYTIVRIKSILAKASEEDRAAAEGCALLPADGEAGKALMLDISGFGAAIGDARRELAPHKICAYIYQLSNDFNRAYHETKILAEENDEKRRSYLSLLRLTERVLETSINLLGFSAPDHM